MAYSNTFDTGEVGSGVGNREALSDETYRLSFQETPLLSSLDKIRVPQTNFEWTLDQLDDPADNFVGEGQDVTAFKDKFKDLERAQNFAQKSVKTFQVSEEQEMSDSVTPVDYAKAEMKAMLELHRDIEKTLCSTQAKSGTNPRKTAGFGEILSGSSTLFPTLQTPSDSIHASGELTESKLNDLIDSIWAESGTTQNLRLYADYKLRSEMVESYTRIEGSETFNRLNFNVNGTEYEIPYSVERFRGNHGLVTIMDLNPKCTSDTTNNDTGFLINPEYAAIGEYGSYLARELEENLGGRRGYCRRYFMSICKNPLAHGLIQGT